MTAEEEVVQLKKELAAERAKSARLEEELARERAEKAQLRQMLEEMLRRLEEVEGQLAKDSHNSSKPPSSDGLGRKRLSLRKRSEKKPGGQPGHPGHTLKMMERPDEVVKHRPVVCHHCQHPLSDVAGRVRERRQVQDLPEMRLHVREHQVEEVPCPACGQPNVGSFPTEVMAPVQYGPNVQALAVYLHQGQLLPIARTCEVLNEVCGCHLSQGTLLRWVQEAAQRLAVTVEQIADWLSVGRLQHGDETGVRIAGKLHWLHVNCTDWLTHLAWHQKRGRQAMDAIGIWPRFKGRAMHDRWASYDKYAGAHSLCGAHLLRDCLYLAEQHQQVWAAEMADHLLAMHHAAHEWCLRGATCVPRMERDEWVTRTKGNYKGDVGIVAVGETPYAEGNGDTNTLALSSTDATEVSDVCSRVTRCIVLLFSGRPIITNTQLKQSSAFVAAWIGSTEGEDITDVLFGDYGFRGHLTYTWPNAVTQEPCNYNNGCTGVLFPYRYGITPF